MSDLNRIAAHDNKWCLSTQGQLAAYEAVIDIVQRLRYTVPDFYAGLLEVNPPVPNDDSARLQMRR